MTAELLKISSKVQASIDKGFKKKSIAKLIGVSKPTFDSRLKDNSWQISEIITLEKNGII